MTTTATEAIQAQREARAAAYRAEIKARRIAAGLPAEKVNYWDSVSNALAAVAKADTAAEVVNALNANLPDVEDRTTPAADAFFYGTGGDNSLAGALRRGWVFDWLEGGYYYRATSPAGDWFTYCEGDVYLNRGC